MKKELTLRDYLIVIYRRRWTLIISVVAVLLSTALFLFMKPPVYEAASTFMLESKQIGFDDKIGMSFTEQSRPIGYYEAVMNSRDFRNRLFQLIWSDTLLNPTLKENGAKENLAKLIRTGMRLSESAYTDFIRLITSAGDPHLAYSLTFHSTELLKVRCQEIDSEELKNAVDFIDNQIIVSQENLEHAEEALQEFKRRTNIAVSDEDGSVLSEIVRFENELTQIQSEIEMTRSNKRVYERRLSSLIKGYDVQDIAQESPEVNVIRIRIAELEAEKIRFQLDADIVNRIDEQIVEERRKMVQIIMASASDQPSKPGDDGIMLKSLQRNMVEQELTLSQLQNREAYYKRQINDFKKDNPNLMQDALEYMRLKRSQVVAENLYTYLLQKGEEARIKTATSSGGLRIIDNPVLPKNPLPVNIPRNLVLAFILGLGLGFGVALLQEYMDHTIQTREDIVGNGEISLLGTVPSIQGLKIQKSARFRSSIKMDKTKQSRYPTNGIFLIHQMKPKNPAVEAYRTMRANLEFTAVDEDIHEVLVTSPNPSEGKTITSANIAIAYALMGKKVCLVDADLRKPKQHTLFKTRSKPGLVEYLVEGLPLSKIATKSSIPNLYIIPCGKIPPNPTELITSKKMTTFIRNLRDTVDIVIYDSAPLLPVTDSMILASRLQGMLLVFRHGQTHKEAIARCLEVAKSSRSRIFGGVLNNVPVTRGYGYYYYSYYHRGYYQE